MFKFQAIPKVSKMIDRVSIMLHWMYILGFLNMLYFVQHKHCASHRLFQLVRIISKYNNAFSQSYNDYIRCIQK